MYEEFPLYIFVKVTAEEAQILQFHPAMPIHIYFSQPGNQEQFGESWQIN